MNKVTFSPKRLSTKVRISTYLSPGIYMIVEIYGAFYIAQQVNRVVKDLRPFEKKNGELSKRKKKFTEIKTYWITTNPRSMFSSMFESPYGYTTRKEALYELRKHSGVLIIENKGITMGDLENE
jgi:hypothetical protein